MAGEKPTNKHLLEAYKYIQNTIDNPGKLKYYPEIRVLKFPKELLEINAMAVSLRVSNPKFSWVGKVPKNGVLVFRDDVDMLNVVWKGIAIHEICHHIDFFSKEGCKCDPYTLGNAYYLEQGLTFEEIYLMNGLTKHSFERKCEVSEQGFRRLDKYFTPKGSAKNESRVED